MFFHSKGCLKCQCSFWNSNTKMVWFIIIWILDFSEIQKMPLHETIASFLGSCIIVKLLGRGQPGLSRHHCLMGTLSVLWTHSLFAGVQKHDLDSSMNTVQAGKKKSLQGFPRKIERFYKATTFFCFFFFSHL